MAGRTKSLPGYPAPGPKGKYTVVWEQPGINYTAGAGNRQTVQAAQLGMKGFDSVIAAGISESGTYMVLCQLGSTIVAGAAVAQHPAAVTYVTLIWLAIAGMTEPTADLTGETVRLRAVCI